MFEAWRVTTSAPRRISVAYEERTLTASSPEVIGDTESTLLAKHGTRGRLKGTACSVASTVGKPLREQHPQRRNECPKKAAFIASEATFRINDADAIAFASKPNSPTPHGE